MKELTIEITDKCSLSCIQCSTMAKPSGRIFFSPRRVERYLEKFPDFDTVRISGGEPFEHPKLEEIVSLIHSKEREMVIMSCGIKNKSPIEERYFKRIKPYVKNIVFSMQGYYSVHDSIVSGNKEWTDEPPYWDYLCDSIDNALITNVPFSLQTVLMRNNYNDLKNIALSVGALNAISKRDIDWHVLRFVKQGRGARHSAQTLENFEIDSALYLLKDLAKYYKFNLTYSNSFEQQSCDCESKKAVVTCYGEILPCSALKHSDKTGQFACEDRL